MDTIDMKIENSHCIKPINVDTVHKICSGQVVLSLAIAVKELVENSLDAGATNIEIRLKNYGIDLIEVSDNGSGVTEDNFSALTLKYHTSKLTDYSDLLGVTSFGFRGEALSSLCALANMTVTTRHKTSKYATKIEYDIKGNITKKTPCSRQVGTSVSLTNLFHSLPVRQKEFHKNAKREFNKMTQLLYAYCLISLGVKITCSNQTSSNAKLLVVATQGSTSYKDNISCVFGVKQLQSILEIKPEVISNIKDNIFRGLAENVEQMTDSEELLDVEIDLSEDSNDTVIPDSQEVRKPEKCKGYKNVTTPIEFTGFISSCAHGSGRSTTDRQFFFVNNRPCEPTKVIKVINEIYRQYNPNQYPFVFLNVNVERTAVDVNVTPDKRKIFMTKEKIILDVLKNSLLKLFESIPRTLTVESPYQSQEITTLEPELSQPRIYTSFLQKFNKSKSKDDKVQELKRKSTTMLDFVSSKTSKRDTDLNQDVKHEKRTYEKAKSMPKINESDSEPKYSESTDCSEILSLSYDDIIDSAEDIEENDSEKVHEDENDSEKVHEDENDAGKVHEDENDSEKVHEDENDSGKVHEDENDSEKVNEDKNDSEEIHESAKFKDNREIFYLEATDNLPQTQIRDLSEVVHLKTHTYNCKTKGISVKDKTTPKEKQKKRSDVITDKEDLGKSHRKTITLKTSIEHVRALTNIYQNKNKTAPTKVKFKSEINPVFNKKCEEELIREISKESFKDMKVIGQFNLGFIITKLEDDLFIIDQHATDEIYNFETLQKTTELTSQRLVIPQQLELTGVNEQILIDNLDVFKKNGFTFEINENALPTKRVKLLTLPMSKNWIFGKEDIEELLFMLRESPSEYCRPSRVRAMFASRACRKSVMIGTALSKADMKKLVDHMAEIDKPWNCPHGRPTIRHLVNLAMVHTKRNCD